VAPLLQLTASRVAAARAASDVDELIVIGTRRDLEA
jgi:hypothetical protein